MRLVWGLGGYWDEGVRGRAWGSLGWVVEVGGKAMQRRAGQVMEGLVEAEVEAARQVELNERTAGFVGEEMKEAQFVVEAKERAEGWRRTEMQVRELKAQLIRRWPTQMKEWRETEAVDKDVGVQ